jgi:hypothetical protein
MMNYMPKVGRNGCGAIHHNHACVVVANAPNLVSGPEFKWFHHLVFNEDLCLSESLC